MNWVRAGTHRASHTAWRGTNASTESVHPLVHHWQRERQLADLDQFHWVNEAGQLSVHDLMVSPGRSGGDTRSNGRHAVVGGGARFFERLS